jgi:purine-cytosine permease-like protein
MDRAPDGERHSDDELASALEEEVARITSAIPIVVPHASPTARQETGAEPAEAADESADPDDEAEWTGPPTELISFDDLPGRREPTGPEPTFSPWVATAAIPIQRPEAAPPAAPVTGAEATASPAAPLPGLEPASATRPESREAPEVAPPAFRPVARAEPLDLVPAELAPRDSEPVPLVTTAPSARVADTPPSPSAPIADSAPVAALPAASAPVERPSAAPHARHLDTDVPDDADDYAGPGNGVHTASAPVATPRTGDAAALLGGRRAVPGLLTPETVDLEPTPVELRVGRASRMFWLWFAGTSSLISVGVGATLFVLGLNLRQLLIATLIGVALSFLPLGIGTLAGKWSGQPTLVVSRATFGMRGNVLPTVLALGVKLFWGAVLLWLAGSAAGSLTAAERWPGSPVAATVAGLAVTIVVAVTVAYAGYGLVARVQLVLTIASAALIVLMVAATWRHVDLNRALTVPDALWTHVVTGAVLVFSYVGLAWAMSSAEVARYQRPRSSGGAAMLWATFGAAVPPFVLVSYGGLLAASNPGVAGELAQDPVAGLVRLGLPAWYPVPLLLAVGLSLVSALVLTIYSAGFTLDALGVRLGRRRSTLVAGAAIAVVGGVLAATVTDLSSVVRGLPTALSVPVAAWVGVFSGEMMLRTRRFHQPSLVRRGGVYPDWRWVNLALLVGGTAIGLGLVSSELPWLAWEGYLFRLAGLDPAVGLGSSNIGVVAALAVGLLGALLTGARAVRRQEAARA